MSILIGVRREDHALVSEAEMYRLATFTKRYAPDGTFFHTSLSLGMGFQPFHTSRRGHLDPQPRHDRHGNAVTLDGRLDNRDDLRRRLGIAEPEMADSSLVLTAFLSWGEECFSQFVGDWAVALWVETEQCLYLARDHAGTRTLYLRSKDYVHTWSTYLETLLGNEDRFVPDENYAACFLSSSPFHDLTPYKGIRAVRPAHWMKIQDGTLVQREHWSPARKANIFYKLDSEYQAHFFSLFQQSVERRASEGEPILAQLSGGMDSTSIVCMSDYIRRSRMADADLIDTLSLYDDTEPNWNERPYFSITEARRGKVGIHLEVASLGKTFRAPAEKTALIFPGSDSSRLDFETAIQGAIKDRGYRVILSGIGGDELLGGVPTPLPELIEHLASFRLRALVRQAAVWSVTHRLLFWSLLWQTLRFACDFPSQGPENPISPWISHRLRVALERRAELHPSPSGSRLRDASTRSVQASWNAALESAPHLNPDFLVRYEYRYPYFDRDLVDFLLSVPRDQLVRPCRRRYLMREVLKNIVPSEILERRRKAYIVRGQATDFESARGHIHELMTNSLAEQYGFIDAARCLKTVSQMNENSPAALWHQLLRTAMLETWLRAASTSDALIDFNSVPERPAHGIRMQPTPTLSIAFGNCSTERK